MSTFISVADEYTQDERDDLDLYIDFLDGAVNANTEPSLPLYHFLSQTDHNHLRSFIRKQARENTSDRDRLHDVYDLMDIPWEQWAEKTSLTARAVYEARLRRNAFAVWFEVYADMIVDDPEWLLDDMYPPAYQFLDEDTLVANTREALLAVQSRIRAGEDYPAHTTAEEMLLYYMSSVAQEVAPDHGIPPAFDDPCEFLLEDTDFLLLFDPRFDGIEDSPVASQLGMTITGPSRWFQPFTTTTG